MNSENVAVDVGEWGGKNFQPLYFGGHAAYVRKCLPGQQWGDDVMTRHIGGIILPDQSSRTHEFLNRADRTNWVEILALGPKVGTRASKKHAKLFERARWFGDDLKVGMIAHVKKEDGLGIQISPLNPDAEYIIEESLFDLLYTPVGESDG
jgi:hypothetical protein